MLSLAKIHKYVRIQPMFAYEYGKNKTQGYTNLCNVTPMRISTTLSLQSGHRPVSCIIRLIHV